MRTICIIVFAVLLICGSSLTCYSEVPFKIAILQSSGGLKEYKDSVESEIETLLKGRAGVEFIHFIIPLSDKEETDIMISGILSHPEIDCVIGLDLGVSDVLAQLSVYPKPVIAASILDANLQGLKVTAEGTSGVKNFNYIEPPFAIEKDLRTFRSLYKYKHLGILHNANETYVFHTVYSYLGKAVEKVAPDASLTTVELDVQDLAGSLDDLPPEVDAIYLPLVFSEKNDDVLKELLRLINKRKLPTFALQGERIVQLGAMASIAPDKNVVALTRRIAINVLNILIGADAGTQKVRVSNYIDNFVINVGTMRAIQVYPSWDELGQARLINIDGAEVGRKVNLQSIIMEALKTNLDLQITQLETEMQKQQIGLSRAPLLPQAILTSSVVALDKNRATGEIAGQAPYTWYGGGQLGQTIFSDDVLANYQIQKILLKAQKLQESAQVLDTVVTAAQTYIRLLFERSSYTIINNNLSVTRKNLDIARNKAAVGSVGASDVHRWETELVQNQISLNDAYRDIQQARMSLNQVLNREIDEPFIVEDIFINSSVELMITDPAVYDYLDNLDKLVRFGNFLVAEAECNLPELSQSKVLIQSKERAVLNSKRSYYLPDINLTGQIDKVLDEYDTSLDTPSDLDHPWTITAGASWPIFSGMERKYELARNRLEVRKSRLDSMNLRNQVHLQVRSKLETAAVSAREIELSKTGAIAAKRNMEIIQAEYAEGRNSIADLIDAQNANITAQQGEITAKYQFVLDFLTLERAIGRFHFLTQEEERADFVNRLGNYMKQGQTQGQNCFN